MIKNVVFDMGMVLLEFKPENIVTFYTDNKEDQKKLADVIFCSEEWIKLDEGSISIEDAINVYKTKLEERLHPLIEEIMATWHLKLPFYEETYNFIKKLKENGYNTYVLSNTSVTLAKYLPTTKVGKLFDGFVFSAEEKLTKPDARIYQLLYDRFNIKPEESFFVDDRKDNIEAGRKTGMDGFVFDIKNIAELEKKIF